MDITLVWTVSRQAEKTHLVYSSPRERDLDLTSEVAKEESRLKVRFLND